MSGKKSTNRQRQRRQQAAREARARAIAARQRKEKKRRSALVLVTLGVAAVVLLAIALQVGGDDTKVTTTPTTTAAPDDTVETVPGGESAKGKPCVPPSEAIPAGAPNVPVKVGPPPAALVIEDLKPGTGAVVTPGSTVTVNYIGVSCSTGAIFDYSYGKQPATFPLSGVIAGWTEGIPGMKVGGQRLLGIPSEKAYGPQARSDKIKADEALWFVIDLIETKPA
jgi:hypothetical protein